MHNIPVDPITSHVVRCEDAVHITALNTYSNALIYACIDLLSTLSHAMQDLTLIVILDLFPVGTNLLLLSGRSRNFGTARLILAPAVTLSVAVRYIMLKLMIF